MFEKIQLHWLNKTKLKGFQNLLCSRIFSTSSPKTGVHASLKVQDGIGVVGLDSPGKVNVLHLEASKEIEEILSEIRNSSGIIGGVLISKKPNCFIAGADINLIETINTAQRGTELSYYLQDFLDKYIEASNKPFVAAIMGSCLGGGLEAALACHYRIAVNGKSTFSFPEVTLGILPGAGGTQRLPKLVGLPDALDLILTGKNIQAEKAKAIGLVDLLIDPLGPGLEDGNKRTLNYLEQIAIQTSHKIAKGIIEIKREPKGLLNIVKNKLYETSVVRNYILKEAKKKVMKQTRGFYPAPLKILDVTRVGLEKGKREGNKAEAKGFGELAVSNESKGLRSLYFGIQKCKENKLGKSNINSVAILGAGLMGAGIADISIRKGYKAILKDSSVEGLKKGQTHIENTIKKLVKRRKISNLEGEKYFANLIPTTEYDNFSSVDIVIEAVFEDIELKQKILREVEMLIPEHCIFATNTSALSITKIAEASKRPENVIGMHYFSPVDKMQLLEVVTTDKTSKEALRTALTLGLSQGKVPIIVKDGPGFYTSRVIMPLVTESFRLMCEGVEGPTIDSLIMDTGFPIGSVTLTDEVGIDVCYHVYRYFLDAFGERANVVDPQLGQDITDAGILGRKSGKGSYIYRKGSEHKTVNQEALKIIDKYKQTPKLPLTNERIKFRVLSRFVNEAVLCLQEEVIPGPLEGDVGAVLGIGFPPFTGGPFHFIDSFGAAKFVDKMRELESGYGPSFTPCQLLVDHAKDSSKKFFK